MTLSPLGESRWDGTNGWMNETEPPGRRKWAESEALKGEQWQAARGSIEAWGGVQL
jgi:hypothetical protein